MELVDGQGGRFDREARLANAAGPGHRDQANTGLADEIEQGLDLAAAPDEGIWRGGEAVDRSLGGGIGPDGGCVADGAGEGAGFLTWLDAKLVGEGRLAALELAEGVLAATGGGEGTHECSVSGFVGGIGLEDALDRGDGMERAAGFALQIGVVEGGVAPGAAEVLAAGDGPVEIGLVGEEIAAVEGEGGRQVVTALGIGCGGKLGFELVDVDPGDAAGAEANDVAGDIDVGGILAGGEVRFEGAAETVDGDVEGVEGGLGGRIWPEGFEHLIAGEAPAWAGEEEQKERAH